MASTILRALCVSKRATVIALAMTLALSLAFVGFVAPPVAATAGSTYYNVSGLDALWTNSLGRDINESGEIAGQGQNPSGQARAFLWESGQMKDLGVPTGGNLSRARGINGSGQVVGEWRILVNRQQRFKAFLYEDGQMKDLNALIPASSGWDLLGAQAINESGQIVGSGTINGQTHAFVYEGGKVTDLGVPLGDPFSEAWGINDSGDVVGGSGGVVGQGQAFIYADGVVDKFGALLDHSVHPSSEAMNLNDSGQVVGWSYTDIRRGHAFLYDNNEDGEAKIVHLDPLPDDLYSRPRDIDESGRVVGWSRDETGVSQDEQFSAVLWEDGQVKDLNALIPANSGWKLVDAYAINDSGRIVGAGFKDGQTRAFLLTPDITPPKLHLPANITEEATTKDGAEVLFAATATDENPANPQVSCTPASGSTFPIGETNVMCSAEDKAGNKAESSFKGPFRTQWLR